MPSKFKNMVRERMAKTGESWQTAARHVRADDPRQPVAEDMLRSFHAPSYGVITRDGTTASYGTTTFSLRCKRCQRWIHAGEAPHRGTCFCGQNYRVIFVPEEDWSLPHGPCCMDCGAAHALTQPQAGCNPWHLVNEWQERCNRCHQRHLAYDQATARPGFVLILAPGLETPIEAPGNIRCVLRPPGWEQWPYLVETVKNGETILMTSDDSGIAERFTGAIKPLSECNAGDEVYSEYGVSVTRPVLWLPLKVVVVGEVGPNVTTMRTLEAALKARSMWSPALKDVHDVKAHLLMRFPTFDTNRKSEQLALVSGVVRQAMSGRIPAVVKLIDRIHQVSADEGNSGFGRS